MRRIQLKWFGAAFYLIFLAGCAATTNQFAMENSRPIDKSNFPPSLQPFIESATASFTATANERAASGSTTLTLTLTDGQSVTITKGSSSGIQSSLDALATQSEGDIAGNISNNILNSIGLVPSTSCD